MKCPCCGSYDVKQREGYQGGYTGGNPFGGGVVVMSSHCNSCKTRSNVAYMCNNCTSYLCGTCAAAPSSEGEKWVSSGGESEPNSKLTAFIGISLALAAIVGVIALGVAESRIKRLHAMKYKALVELQTNAPAGSKDAVRYADELKRRGCRSW